MKCPKCGAENPDYAFFCGRCAADLKEPASVSTPLRKSQPSIYDMLSRRLLRLEGNLQPKGHGALGRLREALYKGGDIVFKSDLEVVTLVLGKDHHASIVKGAASKAAVTLDGPHDGFVTMFPEHGGFGYLPDSINVVIVGLEGLHMRDLTTERLMRDLAESLLRELFK